MINATLMNKTTSILEIEIEENKIMSVGRVLEPTLMPIQLSKDYSIAKVNEWFSSRLIPQKREGLTDARMQFHGFDKDRNYFSLSDQYWVRYNKNENWQKLNFFTNIYSPEVGYIFFEPWKVQKESIMAASPDRTTNGALRKHWVQDPDSLQSYLVKAGSVIYHQEPLSEVLASIMLEKMNLLPYVPYELVVDGLRFCSKCPNFITQDTEFVPAMAIYNQEPANGRSVYDHLIYMCDKWQIVGAKEFLDKMITVDRILYNDDRHLGNFGFIRSADTGRILGFAPLFDCGSAYWGTAKTVQKRKSRFFEEQERYAISKAIKKGWIKGVSSDGQMKDLILSYPEIEKKKKQALIQMLDEMDLEIEQEQGELLKNKISVKSYNKEVQSQEMEIFFDR